MDVPAEISRREARLSAIAKAKIEQRAAERHQLEQQEYEAKTTVILAASGRFQASCRIYFVGSGCFS